jgi:hypothetical protein
VYEYRHREVQVVGAVEITVPPQRTSGTGFNRWLILRAGQVDEFITCGGGIVAMPPRLGKRLATNTHEVRALVVSGRREE